MINKLHLGVALLLLALAASASPLGDLAAFNYNPKANPDAVVTSGSARFTVISPWVIRMEYDENQSWEDRATIAMVNRYNSTVPQFNSTTKNGVLSIETSEVKMEYQVGNPFSWQTLSARSANGAIWKYGDTDYGNLLGTIKSLDMLCTISLNCTENKNTIIHNETLHCAWGVVSRGGWTTIDDTGNYIMGAQPGEWFSNEMKNRDEIDLYFFGHADNYRQALKDFTFLSGNIPMLPRPMLGSWYTRWFDFDNSDIERLVDIYEEQSVPLTLLVFDMNWHTKNDWTGYSWDKQLFPNPSDNLAWLRNKGLIVAANLHDADGIGWWEDEYREMCMVMGQDPSTLQAVPFQPLNETYMHALEDIVLKNAGLDFYWIDWQQGGWAGGCSGGRMNPTLITDHVRSTDNLRQGINQRDAVLARWGGLGNQRYPVGFSGDVLSLTWECMAFQPYFSITGSNVGYGYWSNDLVGPANDHELHVRWMQFGAFSGIMRIHDRGMSTGPCYADGSCAIVNIWKIPYHYFDAIRKAMQARVALLPYMYTLSFEAYQDGVTPMYPMYYDYPSHNDAYAMGPDGVHAQYMMGRSIIVAPICAAASSSSGLATKEIWLPPGVWYDDVFGVIHKSVGQYVESNYALEDVPLFFKAGAIIPRLPNPQQVGIATQMYNALDFYIYPGESSGSYDLYEDDAMSYNYLKKKDYAFSKISYTKTGASITITITSPGAHSYVTANRHVRIFIVMSQPITEVSIGSTKLPYARFMTKGTYGYDGKTVSAIIDLGDISTASTQTVTATFLSDDITTLAYAKGYASRGRLAKRMLDDLRITPCETTVCAGLLKQAGARPVDLTYQSAHNTSMFTSLVGQAYEKLVLEALSEIGGNPNPSQAHGKLIQLYDSDRNDMCLCGSTKCLNTNYNYKTMWIEGYQPSSVSTDAVPLYDYWNANVKDNYATTESNPPSGYVAAVFSNGKVYSAGGTDRACLDVFFNPSTGDHITTATKEGKDFAAGNSYVKSHECIAYVDSSPPLHHGGAVLGVNRTMYTGMRAGDLAKLLEKSDAADAELLFGKVVTQKNAKKSSVLAALKEAKSFIMKSERTHTKPSPEKLAAPAHPDRFFHNVDSNSAMTMAQALLQSCLPPTN